ncbi:MAG: tetratricopeptide repeat protein [Pseudomonadota bacterium]
MKEGFRVFFLVFLLVAFSACSRRVIRTASDGGEAKLPPSELKSESELPESAPLQPATPMQVASLRLTEQARWYLEKKDSESAIRILERAITLHPSNGENYYLLADAWALKKNIEQAMEFNRLAEMYLKQDRTWMERIEAQRRHIQQKR